MNFKRVSLLSVLAGILLHGVHGAAQEVELTYGFDGFPQSPVEGEPGEVLTFEIYPTLGSSGIDPSDGVYFWTSSMEITGGNIQSIDVHGVVVEVVYWIYVGDHYEVHEHAPADLGLAFTHVAGLATKADDLERKGAITAILLGHNLLGGTGYLQPNTTQRVARLTVQATVPEDEAGQEVVLRYVDGFKTAVSQPVDNEVNLFHEFNWRVPSFQECRFTVKKRPPLSLAFGFEGAPSSPVEGAPGETKSFEVYLTLTSSGVRIPDGPESWAAGVGIQGGKIAAIDVKGILVSTIFDDDEDPSTPPLDPYSLDLGSAWKKDAELAAKSGDPPREGAISMVVLSGAGKMTLQPNGTQRIARMVVEAKIPEVEDQGEVVLKFEDGFRSTGSPRVNSINIDSIYQAPALGECRITLRKGEPGMQVPGDADGSGSLDLSDGIFLFGKLFLGSAALLPCGGGSLADQGNLALLDWQPDGAIDISDGIALLQFLFLGGPPHHLAVPGAELQGCVPLYGCPDRPGCR